MSSSRRQSLPQLAAVRRQQHHTRRRTMVPHLQVQPGKRLAHFAGSQAQNCGAAGAARGVMCGWRWAGRARARGPGASLQAQRSAPTAGQQHLFAEVGVAGARAVGLARPDARAGHKLGPHLQAQGAAEAGKSAASRSTGGAARRSGRADSSRQPTSHSARANPPRPANPGCLIPHLVGGPFGPLVHCGRLARLHLSLGLLAPLAPALPLRLLLARLAAGAASLQLQHASVHLAARAAAHQRGHLAWLAAPHLQAPGARSTQREGEALLSAGLCEGWPARRLTTGTCPTHLNSLLQQGILPLAPGPGRACATLAVAAVAAVQVAAAAAAPAPGRHMSSCCGCRCSSGPSRSWRGLLLLLLTA